MLFRSWDFVEKMPDGINSVVSQGGKNFSGGQRQRLAIARAIAANPDILILDDSMSALDYATDLALRKAIAEKMKGISQIIISQRVTSIKNCDRILVLDDGKSAGFGTHDELKANCRIYQEICEAQDSED